MNRASITALAVLLAATPAATLAGPRDRAAFNEAVEHCKTLYSDLAESDPSCERAVRALAIRFGDEIIEEMRIDKAGVSFVALVVMSMQAERAKAAGLRY